MVELNFDCTSYKMSSVPQLPTFSQNGLAHILKKVANNNCRFDSSHNFILYACDLYSCQRLLKIRNHLFMVFNFSTIFYQ